MDICDFSHTPPTTKHPNVPKYRNHTQAHSWPGCSVFLLLSLITACLGVGMCCWCWLHASLTCCVKCQTALLASKFSSWKIKKEAYFKLSLSELFQLPAFTPPPLALLMLFFLSQWGINERLEGGEVSYLVWSQRSGRIITAIIVIMNSSGVA